jgi:UDP-glucose 4-epimerase
VRTGARRAGDPAVLVASSEKIRRELGWSPQQQDLRAIVSSAWEWMQAHPKGYAD